MYKILLSYWRVPLFLILIMSMCVASCSNENDYLRIVKEWAGMEIVVPEDYIYQVMDTPVDYDFDSADFKIIAYVDSSECTSCMMKLYQWNKVMNELKSVRKDVSINFLMVLEGNDRDVVRRAYLADMFPYPIVFDEMFRFSKTNKLPDNNLCHTFLLDIDNKILAIGNPVQNPKVKELFKKLIEGNSDIKQLYHTVDYFAKSDTTIALGVINANDTLSRSIDLNNGSNETLYIEDIISSCACTSACVSCDSISSGASVKLNITVVPEKSSIGEYQQTLDIYYT